MTPADCPPAEIEAFRAAGRLRHDIGKAIRLSAPDTLETDAEFLRARLNSDVRETRRGPGGATGAVELFARWRRETEGLFPAGGPLGARVATIAELMSAIAPLSEALDTLDRAGLERLDRLTRELARECRNLADEARPKSRKA
jgi:hypothetical protein